jgi:hypothetical protein
MPVYLSEQWPSIVQALAAVAQVVTAIIIVRLTQRLVRATDIYAALTKTAVDLSTKQYEGDVSPMWHLTIFPAGTSDNEVWLRVSNLAKNSAIVTYLLIRAESEGELEPQKFLLNVGIPGQQEQMSNARKFIMQSLQAHIVDGEWTGILEVSIVYTFKPSSVQIPSDPFHFKVTIREGRVTSVQPRVAISVEPRKANSE